MMTRRSGRWTAFKYLLALPALGLLVVAFAEPQVTVAQGAKTPGTVTAAPRRGEEGSGGRRQDHREEEDGRGVSARR